MFVVFVESMTCWLLADCTPRAVQTFSCCQ